MLRDIDMFPIATPRTMTSIVLKLTINVAATLWSADIINNMLDIGSEGFSSRAMQQGGIGLLLTALVISVPPMAAMFSQGTVGNFMHLSAFGGGVASQDRRGSHREAMVVEMVAVAVLHRHIQGNRIPVAKE